MSDERSMADKLAEWFDRLPDGGMGKEHFDALLAIAIPSHEHPIRDRGEPVAWRWKAHGHEDGPWIVVHDGATAGAAMALFASKGKPNRVEPLYASLPPARVEEADRATIIEQCAKIADDVRHGLKVRSYRRTLNQIDEHTAGVADGIAAKIRALLNQGAAE